MNSADTDTLPCDHAPLAGSSSATGKYDRNPDGKKAKKESELDYARRTSRRHELEVLEREAAQNAYEGNT